MIRKGLFVAAAAWLGVYTAPFFSSAVKLWGYGYDPILQAVGAAVFATLAVMIVTRRPI
jgi:hypothetical protein